MIIRERYLRLIRPFYEQDLIKVITGIRRSGKSVILKQIIDEILKTGVKKENIIFWFIYCIYKGIYSCNLFSSIRNG